MVIPPHSLVFAKLELAPPPDPMFPLLPKLFAAATRLALKLSGCPQMNATSKSISNEMSPVFVVPPGNTDTGAGPAKFLSRDTAAEIGVDADVCNGRTEEPGLRQESSAGRDG